MNNSDELLPNYLRNNIERNNRFHEWVLCVHSKIRFAKVLYTVYVTQIFDSKKVTSEA